MSLQLTGQMLAVENAKARALLERAIALDPNFAAALATLSLTHSWDVGFAWTNTPGKSVSAALEIARRAVAADPREASAHAALGAAYLVAGDARNGLDAARRAVDLNPSMCSSISNVSKNSAMSSIDTNRPRSQLTAITHHRYFRRSRHSPQRVRK